MKGHARWILACTCACAVFAPPAIAAPPAPPPPPPKLDPLPMLPSVPRVRVEIAPDRVVVLEDIALPRGAWKSGDLDLYIAFGAPGAPRAFDAHLLAVPDGALDPEEGDAGEPVAFERAPRRPNTAHPLLGRPQMAGAVVHVKEASFKKATTAGGMAILRVRTLLDPPPEAADHGHELVVRLGASNGQPLTLGRVQVVGSGQKVRVLRADAHLCGAEADTYPLSVSISPKPPPPSEPPATDRAPIAPVLSVRHASDDLCVVYAAPGQ